MKDVVKIGFVFVGTIIGAGLASGQEILQFFSLYGGKGFYGIILCGIIYIIDSVVIINLCFKYKYPSYKHIIISACGKKMGGLIDILLTFFLFAGSTIMLSGGGAMLKEYLNIKISFGILLMAFIALIITFFSTKGLVATNMAIVPLSTSTLIILGLLVFSKFNFNPGQNISSFIPTQRNWFLSTMLYSSFNMMLATGVICPMTLEYKNKKTFIKGCILGSIMLTILTLVINYSLIMYYPKSFYNEIPNLYIAKQFGQILPLVLVLIIWFEMLSTEIGNLYSLTNRLIHSFNISYNTSLVIIILASIPFSFIGFSNLIKLLYPPFGAVSLVFICACFYKYKKAA